MAATAVDALHEAVRGRLRVTLAGDGEVDGVRAAVAAAGLGDTIKVAGWLDPAAQILANLDNAPIVILDDIRHLESALT